MKYFLILFISLFLFSCLSNSSESQSDANEDIVAIPNSEKEPTAQEEVNIDSQWVDLVFDKGGCLTGGQRVEDGVFGGRECVMSRSKDWNVFFDRDPKELHDFLIAQLSDTTTTRIHTCPFFNASVGEIAVYGLQNLYRVNWYDFKEFEKYKSKEVLSAKENEQAWLQAILEDEGNRKTLISCWEKKASS